MPVHARGQGDESAAARHGGETCVKTSFQNALGDVDACLPDDALAFLCPAEHGRGVVVQLVSDRVDFLPFFLVGGIVIGVDPGLPHNARVIPKHPIGQKFVFGIGVGVGLGHKLPQVGKGVDARSGDPLCGAFQNVAAGVRVCPAAHTVSGGKITLAQSGEQFLPLLFGGVCLLLVYFPSGLHIKLLQRGDQFGSAVPLDRFPCRLKSCICLADRPHVFNLPPRFLKLLLDRDAYARDASSGLRGRRAEQIQRVIPKVLSCRVPLLPALLIDGDFAKASVAAAVPAAA